MSALLTSTAIGVLAAWPAAGLGWALGKTADAITEDPGPRARAWALAGALPAAALGLVVLASQLPTSVAPPIVAVAPTVQEVKAASVDLAAQSPWLPDLFSLGAGALIAASAAGLAVAAARQALGRRRLARIVRGAHLAPAALVQANQVAAARLGVSAPPILVSDLVDQPLLAGLSRPVILLPSPLVSRLDAPRLALICAHELAHLKRRDNWRLLVESLVGGLFWMVPPAVFLRIRAAAVREELCDRLALSDAPAVARRDYADSLIQVLRLRAAPSPHPAFTGKEGHPTAMRLKAILEPRRPAGLARKAVLVAIGALALTAVGACSFAAAEHRVSNSSHSSTTISSDGKNQKVWVRIEADKVQILGEGRSAHEGHVSVKGRLRASGTVLLLEGRAPPADFDPTRLPAGAIQRVVLTDTLDEPDGKVTVDVTLARLGAEATPMRPISIMADQQITTRGESRVVFRGRPTITGDASAMSLLVNGAPAPANLDPAKLNADSIDRLEVTPGDQRPDRKPLINIVMKAS